MPQPITLITKDGIYPPEELPWTNIHTFVSAFDDFPSWPPRDEVGVGNIIYDAEEFTHDEALADAQNLAFILGIDGRPHYLALWPTGTGNHAVCPVRFAKDNLLLDKT